MQATYLFCIIQEAPIMYISLLHTSPSLSTALKYLFSVESVDSNAFVKLVLPVPFGAYTTAILELLDLNSNIFRSFILKKSSTNIFPFLIIENLI